MRHFFFIVFLVLFLLTVSLTHAVERKSFLGSKSVDQSVKDLLASKKPDKPFEDHFRKLVDLGAAAVPTLMKLGSQTDLPLDQRWTAVRAVGKINDKHAVAGLIEMLKDPHPTIRMAALRALGDLGDPESIQAVMPVAEDDPALLVRNTAVNVLGQLKAIEAVPTLEKVFWDEKNFIKGKSLFIRRRVILAMGQIEARAATPLLIKALDDKDTTIPPVAINSLERINGLKFAAKDSKQTVHVQWKNWWEEELRRIPLLPQTELKNAQTQQGS